MKKIDSFFDTYEKRILSLGILFLSLGCLFAFLHLLLGIELIQIRNYDELFSLVHQFFVQQSLLGRDVLLILNQPIFEISVLFNVVGSFKFWEVIYFLLLGVLYFSRYKRICQFNIIVLILVIVILILCGILAFQSGSAYEVMNYLRIIGFSLMITQGMSMIVLLYALVKVVMKYYDALQVEVQMIE